MTAGERTLAALRALTEELCADELSSCPEDAARALHFYALSRTAPTEEERFLALYNALGVRLGFAAAAAVIDELLGGADTALRAVRGEGDCDGPCPRFPYGARQLDLLASAVRRRLLWA